MGKHGLGNMLIALAGLTLLGGPSLAAAGQWVVIVAEQTSLQPGALLDGDKPLKLAEGAQLTSYSRSLALYLIYKQFLSKIERYLIKNIFINQ